MDEKNTLTLEQVLNSVPVARDIPVILTQAQYSAIQDLISTIAKNNRVGYISTTHRILVETLIAFYRANTKEDAPVLDNTVLLSFATTISILRGNIRTKHKAVLREVL
ncbi:MAG TPA: hypothetical protein PLJ29_00095 [Leptospiraceae bacterium]|nr:hypothetical protein [Leptospiraceae bacterium]